MQQAERGFIILDFGSQVTQLIARRLRELNFYSEIHPFNHPIEKIRAANPYGIILSGGPSSVYETGAPLRPVRDLLAVAPVLGICYGMQLLTHDLGGKVESSAHREYGFNQVQWLSPLAGVPSVQKVWMSHGDVVKELPPGFQLWATSEGAHPAAMRGERAWGIQFHPEVVHTEFGAQVLQSFAVDFCHAKATWSSQHIVQQLQEQIRQQVAEGENILVALSGGVDSSVVATLLTKTLGAQRVHCVFVNNGLLRKNEYEMVQQAYAEVGLNVLAVDATADFLAALAGVSDPEAKRKAIGKTFIDVFERQLNSVELKSKNIKWLAQGTLYPDVIESFSFHGGPSQTIKSHHNVGGLPARMQLRLIEPVRTLFKDEVRAIGRELGLSAAMIGRHPFPGPGLAIRCLGEVTAESLRILRDADAVFINKLREHQLYDKIWQAFCVLLPVRTVGVQGDGRTYDQVLTLRAVTSVDGMTADWYAFSGEFLREVSSAITNTVRGVSRVTYDITSKPPATIEWE